MSKDLSWDKSTKETIREQMEFAASRHNTYSFFSQVFLQEPSIESWPQERQALERFLTEAGEGPEGVQFGDVIPEDLIAAVENLKQEFYDCFFVPHSGQYVPPFESPLLTYRPGEKKPFGALHSPEGAHVAQCYEAVGFNPWELNIFAPLREIRLPDHIGFELAFMATLCRSELLAWESEEPQQALKWQELQVQFLSEHLTQWIPKFAAALQEIAPGYYARAAQAVALWISSDSEDFLIKREEGQHV